MHDLIVVGGGPAGAAAAITAARYGARVLLLEAGRYPRHKVCGEFVSPEAMALLASLLGGKSRLLTNAPRIHQARLFIDGRVFAAEIAPAAASIPRYQLDAALWRAAESGGVDCRQLSVEKVSRRRGGFEVKTDSGTLSARAVLDASGRWSKLSRVGRVNPPNPVWLGLKAHFAAGEIPDSTDLYFFDGGYCGVQPVGPGRLNACAMVRADVARTISEVLARHPQLAETSRGWQLVMTPLATSPLLFETPIPEQNGVLRAGDAAGFVDPFVGDGIALALRTGTTAAETLCASGFDAARAAERYRAEYARQFLPIFRAASRLRRLLSLPAALRAPFLPLLHLPGVTTFLVRRTRAA